MIRYTYLLIDCLSIIVPLVLSFHPRIRLYRHWNALLPAIVIASIIYCLWDSWFTQMGIWGFSSRYTTGIYVGNLPVEELLFFICIPYACVFTFECLWDVIPPTFMQHSGKPVSYSIAVVLFLLTLGFHSRLYTATAFALPALMIVFATVRKISWLPRFYLVYGILLIPFTVVNGLLTGTGLSEPVVWYNPRAIIGLRILTIPIEDIFYGMGLIMANIWLYIAIRKKMATKVMPG